MFVHKKSKFFFTKQNAELLNVYKFLNTKVIHTNMHFGQKFINFLSFVNFISLRIIDVIKLFLILFVFIRIFFIPEFPRISNGWYLL